MLWESHKTLGNRGFHGSCHLRVNSITAASNLIVSNRTALVQYETSTALGNLQSSASPQTLPLFRSGFIFFGLLVWFFFFFYCKQIIELPGVKFSKVIEYSQNRTLWGTVLHYICYRNFLGLQCFGAACVFNMDRWNIWSMKIWKAHK